LLKGDARLSKLLQGNILTTNVRADRAQGVHFKTQGYEQLKCEKHAGEVRLHEWGKWAQWGRVGRFGANLSEYGRVAIWGELGQIEANGKYIQRNF